MFRKTDTKIDVTYNKMVYLFILGSLGGFLLEGVFSYFKRGAWESHVVSVWGPFCILYGIGFMACYAGYARIQNKSRKYQFIMFGIGGCVLELIGGAVLDFTLHMRAWNYTKHPLNFRGYVSLDMILVWGVMGILFTLIIPDLDSLFNKMEGKGYSICCRIFTAFMIVNLAITAAAMVRWSDRHFDIPAGNAVERKLDNIYPDEYMQKRFCEWKFIE